MMELGKLLHLQGAAVWLPFTIVLYAGSCTLHRRLGKAPIANPTLLTIAALVVILACCGVPYKAYFESVAVLQYLLGTAVVALALPLYRNVNRLHGRYVSMALALVAGSLASIFVGLAVAMLAHASASTVLSLAPKSATAAVSMEISRLIGGAPAVTATVLNALRIHAPEARGFAMGVASHGIATARAFTESEVAGSFAGLGMVLNAVLTALIVPPVVRLFGLA
jgi:putative effector of murein hydrolase